MKDRREGEMCPGTVEGGASSLFTPVFGQQGEFRKGGGKQGCQRSASSNATMEKS